MILTRRALISLLLPLAAGCALPVQEEGEVKATKPTSSPVEVITMDAASVKGGVLNAWGGHQTRVVRTKDGVFSAYIVSLSSEACEWRLAMRKGDGSWPVIARGPCKNEAVNLLAAPDGTLHVISWIGDQVTDHAGIPEDGKIMMESSVIPIPPGSWGYGAAGANVFGDLCISASEGGWDERGRMLIVHRAHGSTEWKARVIETHYRHCYAYLHLFADGGLLLSATRDTSWKSLGLEPRMDDNLGYAFNAFTVWRIDDPNATKPVALYHDELRSEPACKHPTLNCQSDSYLDTEGRLHLIYFKECKATGGSMEYWHRIIGREGAVEHDARLPECADQYNRIFQDDSGRYFLLSSKGFLVPMNERGTKPGKPIKLDIGRHSVVYSGFSIACPRTGTRRSEVLDVVFPAETPGSWLYLEVKLPLVDQPAASAARASTSASVTRHEHMKREPPPMKL